MSAVAPKKDHDPPREGTPGGSAQANTPHVTQLYQNHDTVAGAAQLEVMHRARSLREQGFRLLPIAPGTKKPTVGGFGLNEDPNFTVEHTAFGTPGVMIAILCGPCDALPNDEVLLCLDFDGEGNAVRSAFEATLPATLTSHDGRHRWFRAPKGFANGKIFELGKHDAIDLQSHGRYVRELWDWAPDTDTANLAAQITRLPPTVLEAIGALRPARAATANPVADGDRGDDYLRQNGFDPDEVFADAVQWLQSSKALDPTGKDGGSAMLLAAGGLMIGFGLDDETAECLLCEVYCPRAWPGQDPDEEQIKHKIDEINSGVFYAYKDLQLAITARETRRGAEFLGNDNAGAPGPAPPAPASAGESHPTEDHSHCVLSPLSGWPHILQRGSRYYFHDIDRASYTRSYSEGELLAAVARHLNNQVAETCRSLNDLRAFYIRPIQHVLASYTVKAGTFDPESDTLTQAACRWMPESRARYHADVDRWLRAMFTPVDYELVEMWLAASVALEKPAPLLALIGPALHGKSLFADGLARLWSRSKAAMMSEAFGEFNEAVGYCPLIFADEEIPGDMTFAWLREAITSRTRRVNRKGVSATDVLGCCRMILAANNDQVFRFAKMGVLTAADRDAIERRLLVVDVQPGAVDVLRESDTEAIADHRLAEHVLWLAQTVPVLGPGERMAAPANDGKRMLGPVLFNRQADVLARLRELLDTNGVIGGGTHPAVVRAVDGEQGEVWVNVGRVFDTFRGSVGSKVSRTDIGDVCDSHKLRVTEQHKIDGVNVHWRILSLSSLEASFAGLD